MKVIQERLGHKSEAITSEVYSHVTKMNDDAKENFEKYIKNVFNFSCPIVAQFLKNRSNFYDLVAQFSNKKAKASALTPYIPKSFPFCLAISIASYIDRVPIQKLEFYNNPIQLI